MDYNLEWLAHDKGDYQAAGRGLEGLLPRARRSLGNEHPLTLKILAGLGDIRLHEGDCAQAEQLIGQAVRAQRMQAASPDPNNLSRLAVAIMQQGRWDEAEQLGREALTVTLSRFPRHSPHTTNMMNNLAALLVSIGKEQEAESLLRDVLQIEQKLYPSGHPSLARAQLNLAHTLRVNGRLAEAEQLARESADLLRNSDAGGPADRVAAMNVLASVLQDAGRKLEAETLFREILDIQQGHLPAAHPDTLTARNNLALCLNQLGKNDEAQQLLREVLRARSATLAETHPDMSAVLSNLGNVAFARQQWSEAEEYFRRTLAGLTDRLPATHPHVVATRSNLARSLARLGRQPEAIRTYREILAAQHDDRQFDVQARETRIQLIHLELCEQGAWRAAAEEFARCQAVSLGAAEGYLEALAWLGAGDLGQYRQVLDRQWELWGEAPDAETRHEVAWTAVLAPLAEGDRDRLLRLAQSLGEAPPLSYSRQVTLAAVQIRCGDLAAGIAELQALFEQHQAGSATGPLEVPPSYLACFLAIAFQLQGDEASAARWLDVAERLTPTGQATELPADSWNRRLTLQVLRQEAGAAPAASGE